MYPNGASVHRIISAERGDVVRMHIEEAQVREHQSRARRNLSLVHGGIARVRRNHAGLRSGDARVRRSCARLRMSCTHVYRDISVVH
jgi:hypothetical protein